MQFYINSFRNRASRFAVDSARPRFTLNQTPQHSSDTSRLPSEGSNSPQNPPPIPAQPLQDQQSFTRQVRSPPILPGSPRVTHSYSASPPASPHNKEAHSPVFRHSSPRAQSPSSSPAALAPQENLHPLAEDYTDTTQHTDTQRKKFSFTPSSANSRARSFQLPSSNREQPSDALDREQHSSTALNEKTQVNKELTNLDVTPKPSRNFKFSSYEGVL
jgi:hypothetical protein